MVHSQLNSSSNDSILIRTTSSPTYIENSFNLSDDENCAATMTQTYPAYRKNYQQTVRFEFVNAQCNAPTFWYSYQPIFYDGVASDFTFNMIQNIDYKLNKSCSTNIGCTFMDFCVSNYKLNNSNSITQVEFQIFKTSYYSSNVCSTGTNPQFMSFLTILCGDSNFTSKSFITDQDFLNDMLDDTINQCGNTPNPYLILNEMTTTEGEIDVDTDEIEPEPICTIQAGDNIHTWIILAVAFVLVLISLFFCMTRYVGIEISMEKWGAIIMLILTSLATASIFKALIATFIVMANYEKCNTLESKAPLKPWDWEDDWEKDSLMGFWFWIIGTLISSAIFTAITMIKFGMRSVSQYEYGKIDFGERFIGWCIKGIFFIITFSFSAVLRPYYFIGHHSESGTKCACVNENIALIAEIYGAALISIVLAPCAYKLGIHCLNADDDQEEENWVTKVIGCGLMIYAFYCGFIVVASPFLFIAFRIMEYAASAQDWFTSDDFTMFIWFFEGFANFFTSE